MTIPPSTTGPGSIVVSLEHAKALKKAGWPQEDSYLHWCHHHSNASDSLDGMVWNVYQKDDDDRVNEWIAAPTSEEILRMLPQLVNHFGLIIARTPDNQGWEVAYLGGYKGFREPSLANAAAAMYCYLSENNLLPSSK